jgi:hypothetical protein
MLHLLLSLMLHHLPDRPFFVPLYGRLGFSPRKRTKQGLQRAWGPISCPAPNHAKATPVTATLRGRRMQQRAL